METGRAAAPPRSAPPGRALDSRTCYWSSAKARGQCVPRPRPRARAVTGPPPDRNPTDPAFHDGSIVTSTMLRVKVDRHETTELHEQVAAEIRRAIADGEATPGE